MRIVGAAPVLAACLAGTTLVSAYSAEQATLPRFDAALYCSDAMKALVSEPNEGDNFLRKSCIENEIEMLRKLEGVWPDIPAGIKDQCLRQSKSLAHSYMFLQGCLTNAVATQWLDGKLRLLPKSTE